MEVHSIFLNSIILSFLGYVSCQDYFELRHIQHLRTQDFNHLKEIPKKFEVTGDNPKQQFIKYIDSIQNLAEKENVTVVYRVKLEIMQPDPKQNPKKSIFTKKNKSKKYNIPLKKKNMRLSNFELIMRKLADMNAQKVVINPILTTEGLGTYEPITTTKIPVMKYKPIISRVRTKFAKKNHLKPIKTHEITLTRKKRSIF